MAFIMHV